MQRLFLIAATIALISLPEGLALAQGSPKSETIGAPPAAAPPAAAAPTTTTTPDAAATEKTEKPEKAATAPAKAKKKKPAKQMTRQQEIDKSVDSGTVPARYRSQVPKEYQQYVPFDKR
jgi:hypothetical protein